MKKLLSCLFAAVLMVSVLTGGFAIDRDVSIRGVNTAGGSGTCAEVVVKSGEKQKPVTVDANTAATIEPAQGDYFSEPKQESIVKVSDDCGYVDDEILVFFKDGTSELKKIEIVKSIDAKIVGYLAILNRYQLRIAPSNIEEIQSICDRLMENDEVELAGCNVATKIVKTNAIVPSDPWTDADGVDNTGGWSEENPGGSNWWLEAVQAPSAWSYDKFFKNIDIGIVDSGFDTSHEDLQNKIVFPNARLERENFADDHGTHVAGIIAANANNNIGISGICQKATLHCVDWEPTMFQYWITGERILTGLAYTVRDGAKVVNFSVGSINIMPTNDFVKSFYKMAIDIEAKFCSYVMSRLLTKGYDFVVVQSAGNGTETQAIDAFYNGTFCAINEKNAYTGTSKITAQDLIDRIIVVGAAQNKGNASFCQASFSNGGKRVDICAPGYDILSCYSMQGGKYGYKSGTSMSAPIVTAIAALVWSVNPEFTGTAVKKIVCNPENTCYDVVDNTSEFSPLIDNYRMVNAKLAVEAAIEMTYPE